MHHLRDRQKRDCMINIEELKPLIVEKKQYKFKK